MQPALILFRSITKGKGDLLYSVGTVHPSVCQKPHMNVHMYVCLYVRIYMGQYCNFFDL